MKRLPPIQARTANPLLDFTEGGEGGWSEVCETVRCLSDVQFRLLCQIVALILLMSRFSTTVATLSFNALPLRLPAVRVADG